MIYQRIERPEDLPQEGKLTSRSREKQDIDFKTFVDEKAMSEHAKDIAAFANSLGGVLLIGADNQSDATVLTYCGVQGQSVADVARIYEQAGTLCSPAQNVDVVPIQAPGGVDIVAVNVNPSVHMVVASPGGNKKAGGILPGLWRFPIRRGSQTDDIEPKDLAMYMNQPVRRAYLMLSAIPAEGRKQARFYYAQAKPGLAGIVPLTEKIDLPIEEVPSERNFVVVGADARRCHIPLADVIDVWEESDGVWAIKVSGTLDQRNMIPNLCYRPRF